jgi:Tol biopolymer transport system component/DNA-binding winged helix-turn-helix (wHTH) protein
MTNKPSDRARFGPYEADLHTHELWKFGTRIRLVGQPFEVLAVLLRRGGELVTRDELRHQLWPSDTFVDFNHGLNVAVNKLREALSDAADAPRYIETLPRRGYRFSAPVEWMQSQQTAAAREPLAGPPASGTTIATDAAPPRAEAVEIRTPVSTPPTPSFVVARQQRSPMRYFITAGVFAALLLAVGLGWQVSGYSNRWGHDTAVERTRPLFSMANTASPTFSPDGNSVAFTREGERDGEAGIYVTAIGSEQPTRLTHALDCCPVWSPDGRWIAFTREEEDHQYQLYAVASDGGAAEKRKAEDQVATRAVAFADSRTSQRASERRIDTGSIKLRRREIDWSPDGQDIVFSGDGGLYLVTVEGGVTHRVSTPAVDSEDWGPSFSPDGESLMFVRSLKIGAPDEIWILPKRGGEGRRLLAERGKIASPPQWSFDGRSVIYSSNRNGHPALWRASLDSPDNAAQIQAAGSPAWDPAVSRHGYRLAYERMLRSLSVWQMDLGESSDKRPSLLIAATSDTDQGPGPQFSPDGKKLAYMSDRSGTMEIWISDRDGSHAFQLSAVGGAGTPRWSPDSQFVVFDAMTQNGSKVVLMSLRGGAPVTLTPDEFNDVCPSFSRDGKWVYFASSRSGAFQVWKVPATGGAAIQVTQNGGHTALESRDGKTLYYAKSAYSEPEIWQVPVGGGAEAPVSLVHPGTWASWQVVDGGILFVGPSLGHEAVLSFYDFAKRRTTTLAVLERIPFWLGATPDGRTVAFDQPGREQDQAMLVENFR